MLRREERARGPIDLSWAATPEFASLDARDRALAYELVSGTLRRRGSVDAVLHELGSVDLRRTVPDVRVALRLAAYQLLFLDRVPAHAVVSDAVAQAGLEGRRARGFANAVLRKVAASGRETFATLSAGDGGRSLAIRYSVPEWLVHLWSAELGRADAEAVMAAACVPPERCLRVNGRRATSELARSSLAADHVAAVPVDGLPGALLVGDGPSIETTTAFAEGLVTPQSRGSQIVGLAAAAGAPAAARVLDLCAAPGGKAAQLAALLPAASLTTCERSPERAEAMRRNLERLGVVADVVVDDARNLPQRFGAAFDLVLVDAPCSGLGILAARPDLRWRRNRRDLARLAGAEAELLRAAMLLTAPGGVLTYAVCTLTRVETIQVIAPLRVTDGWASDDLGAEWPELRHPEEGSTLRVLPGRDGSSGFFVARFRRS